MLEAAAGVEITFERGRLRPWRETDAEVLVEAWHDPEIARWNQVPPEPSLRVAKQWIDGQQRRLERGLSVDLVVESSDHDAVVGEVGLSGFNTQHRGALIGYWLLASARGAGLAGASVAAFSEWAHDALALDVIVARCAPDNLASHAVAASAGYLYEPRESSEDHLWCSRTRGR